MDIGKARIQLHYSLAAEYKVLHITCLHSLWAKIAPCGTIFETSTTLISSANEIVLAVNDEIAGIGNLLAAVDQILHFDTSFAVAAWIMQTASELRPVLAVTSAEPSGASV